MLTYRHLDALDSTVGRLLPMDSLDYNQGYEQGCYRPILDPGYESTPTELLQASKAIPGLKPKQRQALLLRAQGKSQNEIAYALHCTQGGVSHLFAAIRRKLRKRVAEPLPTLAELREALKGIKQRYYLPKLLLRRMQGTAYYDLSHMMSYMQARHAIRRMFEHCTRNGVEMPTRGPTTIEKMRTDSHF